jgi:hypothetical protein
MGKQSPSKRFSIGSIAVVDIDISVCGVTSLKEEPYRIGVNHGLLGTIGMGNKTGD